jgi:hypothetical protein
LLSTTAPFPAPATAAGFPAVFRPVRDNPADRLANLPIEDYRDNHARRCTKHPTTRCTRRDAQSTGISTRATRQTSTRVIA